MATNTEKKTKVEITWLQCQLPKSDWEALNQRRLALNLKWADIIVPATKEYIAKLEGKAADASTEVPPTPVVNKGADEKKGARKTKRAKKAPAKVAEMVNLNKVNSRR